MQSDDSKDETTTPDISDLFSHAENAAKSTMNDAKKQMQTLILQSHSSLKKALTDIPKPMRNINKKTESTSNSHSTVEVKKSKNEIDITAKNKKTDVSQGFFEKQAQEEIDSLEILPGVTWDSYSQSTKNPIDHYLSTSQQTIEEFTQHVNETNFSIKNGFNVATKKED